MIVKEGMYFTKESKIVQNSMVVKRHCIQCSEGKKKKRIVVQVPNTKRHTHHSDEVLVLSFLHPKSRCRSLWRLCVSVCACQSGSKIWAWWRPLCFSNVLVTILFLSYALILISPRKSFYFLVPIVICQKGFCPWVPALTGSGFLVSTRPFCLCHPASS